MTITYTTDDEITRVDLVRHSIHAHVIRLHADREQSNSDAGIVVIDYLLANLARLDGKVTAKLVELQDVRAAEAEAIVEAQRRVLVDRHSPTAGDGRRDDKAPINLDHEVWDVPEFLRPKEPTA